MEQRIREPFIVRLVGALSSEKTLETRPWVKKLLTSLTELPCDMSNAIKHMNLQSIFTRNPYRWLIKLWPMSPKQKEENTDDGRDAEDKSQHKGDWGSHSHADKVSQEMEPTEEQLQQAQLIINSQWIQQE